MRFKTRLDKIKEKLTPEEPEEIFVIYDQEKGSEKQIKDLERIKELQNQGKDPQVFNIKIVKTKEDIRGGNDELR